MATNPFDQVARDYEKIHNSSLPPGVRSDEFVVQKAAQIIEWLREDEGRDRCYLDFGCGNGRLFRHLVTADTLQPLLDQGRLQLVGFDTSVASLKEARSIAADDRIRFVSDFADLPPTLRFDLVTSCNVFHHIDPAERRATAQTLRALMNPGARLVLWEHNPFNPLTRLIVKACPFDRDARLLTLNTARAVFEQAAFRYLRHTYVNVFPPGLQRWEPIRTVETGLAKMPLGAQYWVMFARGE